VEAAQDTALEIHREQVVGVHQVLLELSTLVVVVVLGMVQEPQAQAVLALSSSNTPTPTRQLFPLVLLNQRRHRLAVLRSAQSRQHLQRAKR
jgi:hypothetical protein